MRSARYVGGARRYWALCTVAVRVGIRGAMRLKSSVLSDDPPGFYGYGGAVTRIDVAELDPGAESG
jgi:hypothetical protein